MLKIDILTIFPELVESIIRYGAIKYAVTAGKAEIRVIDIRKFCDDKNRNVDDSPYGGGGGMVIKAEPLFKAIASSREVSVEKLLKKPPSNIVYFSPAGRKMTSKITKEYSEKRRITLICGRYEDIDNRVREKVVSDEISIGDYVVSGGELPGCIFIDSILRNIKGVLGNESSAQNDSFEAGLLDFPHYTRPAEVYGLKVPDVILSGDHKKIDRYRKTDQLKTTLQRRRDLVEYEKLDKEQKKQYIDWYSKQKPRIDSKLYVTLLHYPVYDRLKKTIVTSVTNLDIHDICRSSATFDVKKYYISNPIETQRNLVKRVCHFWTEGYGSTYHENRNVALEKVSVATDFKEVVDSIKKEEKEKPIIIGTSAKICTDTKKFMSFEAARKLISSRRPVLIVFGTGWGLADSVTDRCDFILEPINGANHFNHLSVRSAAAIILDRLTINNYTENLQGGNSYGKGN